MSLEQARKLLGVDAERYSDEELQRIINFYSAVSTTIIDQKTKERC